MKLPKIQNRSNEIELMVNDYLNENICYDEPLEWWSKNSSKYPNIAKLVLKYIYSPATSASCKRVEGKYLLMNVLPFPQIC